MLFEPGKLRVRKDPLGVTLIIGAWNEPFMLTLGPLVPAIAAGNTAVIKPSELSVASSAVVAELIPEVPRYRGLRRRGGRGAETTALLAQHWDFIFFTGSPAWARSCTRRPRSTSRRRCWSWVARTRYRPSVGQPQVGRPPHRLLAVHQLGPHLHRADHVLIWPESRDEFVGHLKDAIHEFYGEDPKVSPDYGRIVNDRNFQRIAGS